MPSVLSPCRPPSRKPGPVAGEPALRTNSSDNAGLVDRGETGRFSLREVDWLRRVTRNSAIECTKCPALQLTGSREGEVCVLGHCEVFPERERRPGNRQLPDHTHMRVQPIRPWLLGKWL